MVQKIPMTYIILRTFKNTWSCLEWVDVGLYGANLGIHIYKMVTTTDEHLGQPHFLKS